MKKPLFLVAFIFLLLLGAIFFWQFGLFDFGPKVEVKMTASGFEPDTLNIKKGTKVVFINEDNREHWPASDIHPTHGIYPAFDVQKGVEAGQKWSFVFDKVGKWKFHDHLFPERIGVIEVNP